MEDAEDAIIFSILYFIQTCGDHSGFNPFKSCLFYDSAIMYKCNLIPISIAARFDVAMNIDIVSKCDI